MNSFLQICAFAVLGGVATLLLSGIDSKLSFATRLAALLLIVGLVILSAGDVISELDGVFRDMRGVGEYFEIALKALGIALLAQISAQICRDCGAAGVANGVELAAKIEIFVLCIPLIGRLTEFAYEILNMQ